MFGKGKDMLHSPAINNNRKKKGKHAIVGRINIPRNSAEFILSELNSLGINQRSLFPDMEGLGQYISWEWRFQSGVATRVSLNSPRRVRPAGPTPASPRLRKLPSARSSSSSSEDED